MKVLLRAIFKCSNSNSFRTFSTQNNMHKNMFMDLINVFRNFSTSLNFFRQWISNLYIIYKKTFIFLFFLGSSLDNTLLHLLTTLRTRTYVLKNLLTTTCTNIIIVYFFFSRIIAV